MWQFFPRLPTAEAWETRLFQHNRKRQELLQDIRDLKFNVRGYVYYTQNPTKAVFFGHVMELCELVKPYKDNEIAEIRIINHGYWVKQRPAEEMIKSYQAHWAEHYAKKYTSNNV